MQGFRNYNIEQMQRDQMHVVDMMPPQYGKSTPPQSPNSGKFKLQKEGKKGKKSAVVLNIATAA